MKVLVENYLFDGEMMIYFGWFVLGVHLKLWNIKNSPQKVMYGVLVSHSARLWHEVNFRMMISATNRSFIRSLREVSIQRDLKDVLRLYGASLSSVSVGIPLIDRPSSISCERSRNLWPQWLPTMHHRKISSWIDRIRSKYWPKHPKIRHMCHDVRINVFYPYFFVNIVWSIEYFGV